MIKYLDISDFGPYENFKWNKNKQLEKLNIIYGRNYSGKTCLSRIFSSISDGALHKNYSDGKFEMTFIDGQIVSESDIERLSNERNFLVYNSDFVKENLSWIYDENGNIKPFTILGKPNIELQKEIDKRKKVLGSKDIKDSEEWKLVQYENKLKISDEEYSKASKEHKDELTKQARILKRRYGQVSYNIAKIKSDLSKINENSLLTEKEISQYSDILKKGTKKKIAVLQNIQVELDKIISKTENILSSELKLSNPIKELLNDKFLQNWVKNGLEIHKHKRKTCAFCGSVINDDVIRKIDSHFDKESEKTKKELSNLKEELGNILQGTKREFDEINDKNLFYPTVHNELHALINKVQKDFESLVEEVLKVKNLIDEKISDISKTYNLEFNQQANFDYNTRINELNALISENNHITSSLNKDAAKEKLFSNDLYQFHLKYCYIEMEENLANLKNRNDADKKILRDQQSLVKNLESEINELENKLSDETKAKEKINDYLKNYFRHDELELDFKKDNKNSTSRFVVKRKGIEAKNISEGESGLISFCYFLAYIDDDIDKMDNNIIFIDDPISSLDIGHIFYIYSLIQNVIFKNKNYKQLFISTHNLDFLKYLLRLKYNGKNDKQNKENTEAYFLIEKKKKNDQYRSYIQPMPKQMKGFATEFTYLFSELYSIHTNLKKGYERKYDNTYSTYYNLPNNIRKFLECYLFYKYPNSEEPLKSIDTLFGEDKSSVILINRVINEYSHLTQIERGMKSMDSYSEIEKCISLIFEKMKEKDQEQFDSLVACVS